MYGCECWTIKESGHWRIDGFELWCWKRLLRVTWTAKTKDGSNLLGWIQQVHPKGNQYWTFIGRIDAEAETPIFWLPDVKNWLTRKGPDAGKDWRQEKKGMTEEKMVGSHHQLNRREFEQTQGDSEGQGSLACCIPWGHKVLDMTEWLNLTDTLRIVVWRIPWTI